MADNHLYTAADIDKEVKAGNTGAVKAELNSDYLQLLNNPQAFADIVNKMTMNDANHPLSVERDKEGNPTAIKMTTWQVGGLSLFSSKVFDKGDQSLGAKALNPFESWGAVGRAMAGAAHVTGKDK